MSAVTGTAGRLRRLLAILAWLAQVGEAPIDSVAARFGLSADALVTELELAACCGVPPYTPDQLMEILVTDTTVSTRAGIALSRPRRLSPSEGFALAASARALLAVPGSDRSGSLWRAVDKLERALGGEGIEVELDSPPLLPVVQEAVAAGRRLLVTYYSASSDRQSERELSPTRLFAAEGHWYVDAVTTAGDLRRFRVDRISAADLAGPSDRADIGAGPAAPSGPADIGTGPADRGLSGEADDRRHRGLDPFVPGPDTRTVRLSLDPATAWLVDSVPATGAPVPVGTKVEVEVFVGGDAWLERLLLRLGPDARVVHPPELQSLATDAATRVLRRYQVEIE